MTREAFGAEFDGADGFLDTATYGVPPGLSPRHCATVCARGSTAASR
ncbi:hypothetical protein I552_5605 [Mycobacterium xenopi 3993]|nr:hypothetical protein I552_5605 [Mycobacterium xenopi 3993]